MLVGEWKRKLDLSLKSNVSRYFVGRKHYRKFKSLWKLFRAEKCCYKASIEVSKWFSLKSCWKFRLKHQGSSLESSRIDPLWIKVTRLDPILNKDRVFKFQKLKIAGSTHRNILSPTQAWYNCLFLLCIIIYVYFYHDFMQ